MSGSSPGVGFEVASVLLLPLRQMGTVIPDCVIEEHSSDRLVITEHPVEQGAAISDHAYKLPAEVTLRYGFSNSSSFRFSENYSIEMYENILTLQEKREPFLLFTGKRVYPNMLIASVDQTTDASTEYSLMVTIHCRQIIIVTTSVATIPAPAEGQASNVTPPVNKGAQTPQSAPSDSVINSVSKWFPT